MASGQAPTGGGSPNRQPQRRESSVSTLERLGE